MTEPVSSGARWPRADACCDPYSEERETFTCDETSATRCTPERAQLVAYPDSRPTDDHVAWGLSFCRDADTVVAGFLCSEPVVVSDACRKPHNDFDAFVCDDPRMQRLQWAIVRETWDMIKAILQTIFRAKS